MRVVVDTNVLVSGIFFRGAPGKILDACLVEGAFTLCVSPSILEEYSLVTERLAARYPDVLPGDFISSLALTASLFDAPANGEDAICEDSDDDKFFLCAQGAGARHIISGDKHLLRARGWEGIDVQRPQSFCRRFMA